MSIGHGTAYRQGYSRTAREAAALEGDLQAQRQRTAATLALLAADLEGGRRVMNTATLEAVCQAAARLADLDGALRGS